MKAMRSACAVISTLALCRHLAPTRQTHAEAAITGSDPTAPFSPCRDYLYPRTPLPQNGKRVEEKKLEGSSMASLMEKAKGFVAEKIANMEKPEAEVNSVSVSQFGRGGTTFLAKVDVSNPYSVDIPICEISYTVRSAGRVIASGTIPDPGSIEAKAKTQLQVPAKVPLDFLISLVRDIGSDWDIDYEMEIGLTIDLPIVGNFTIPLKTSGEYKLPTLSDLF